ncbi:MAG: CRISPR-associated protein Cmr3 [Paracoccaceae bacterium]|nr:MAG: CRISPR-associated protein Cmr3 [Paracoccaceae bacterium]
MTGFRWLSLSALDTLMFRDGRPFSQSDAGVSEATSIFPPWPLTVVGAVRAALWQGLPGGKWDTDRLGDGTDWADENSLGPLAFSPPVVTKGDQPIFPAPLHILRGAAGELTLLRPGEELCCDLGKARLPQPAKVVAGARPLEGEFVTARGMRRILDGGLPEPGDIVAAREMFARENRVGIAIDAGTRRVRDGYLYMATHVRPHSDIAIRVGLSGWEGDLPERLIPLGSEHRQAALAKCDEKKLAVCDEIKLPGCPPREGRRVAVALSPVVLEKLPGRGEDLAGLGTVVSACLGKPQRISGWDTHAGRALPMRLALPAGSVWFLEGADGDRGGAAIGLGTKWGFGALALGRWEKS